jgi:hypothetical protein
VLLVPVQECVAADLDYLEMLQVTPKKLLQFIAAVGFALAQECHVVPVAYASTAAVFQATYSGDRLEISVDIKADAYAQVVAVEAHQSAQQELQHTAVSYIAHSVQHSYQTQTAVLYVIIAQAAILAAVMAVILTAAVVLAMWHSKVAYHYAHASQKLIWQHLQESTVKKVRS